MTLNKYKLLVANNIITICYINLVYMMKLMKYLISLMLLPMNMINSYPVNMICVPVCNLNVTASVEFVNDWLNHSSTGGIRQLRSVVKDLLTDASTDVSHTVAYTIHTATVHTATIHAATIHPSVLNTAILIDS